MNKKLELVLKEAERKIANNELVDIENLPINEQLKSLLREQKKSQDDINRQNFGKDTANTDAKEPTDWMPWLICRVIVLLILYIIIKIKDRKKKRNGQIRFLTFFSFHLMLSFFHHT